MFKHYLTLALRSFVRHKLYSFINIVGLAVGLACAIFITLFVREEGSYDRWVPNSEHLYRIEVTFHFPGGNSMPLAQAPFPVPGAMLQEIPEVRAVTHIAPEKMTARVADRQFLETVSVVDPNFLQVIALPFDQAISLQPFLMMAWRSAIVSASAYRTLISSCPADASPFEFSTGMPAP